MACGWAQITQFLAGVPVSPGGTVLRREMKAATARRSTPRVSLAMVAPCPWRCWNCSSGYLNL